jgi:peptide/nickel transport system substrate-binding protein
MKMKKLRLLLTAILVVTSILVVSCTPEETEVVESTTPPEDVVAPTVPPEEPTEEEFSILRVGAVANIDCLNPFGCSNHWDVNNLAYEGFTGIGQRCEIIPRLAKSWELSEDSLTWTLQLQEGARFSDGTPLTAQAAVDWIEWYNSTSLTFWYYTAWNTISVEALDDYTLQLTTEVPIGIFLEYDAPWWWVMPAHEWGELDESTLWTYGELPNGTGPYDITEWVPGEYITFDAKQDYYLGAPAIDRIVYQEFANWDAVIQAIIAGEIDMTSMETPIQYYEPLNADPNITIEERPPGWMRTLYFNLSEFGNKHPAIEDPAVREAIDYAIDRERALAVALEGHGMLCPNNYACGPLYEGDLNPDLTITPFDLAKAQQILDDAGYLDTDNDGIRETADGEALVFRNYIEQGQPVDLVISEQISETLGQIGIVIENEILEFGTLYSAVLSERDYDISVHRYWADIDPAAFDFYLSCWSAEAGSGALNRTGYCNPEVDDLTYLYITTPNRDEARDYIYQAQEILHNDRPFLTITGDFLIEAFRTDRFDFPNPGESCDMTPGHWNWPLILEAKPK